MKRFKIGISLIVAVLAMSFTIASHEGTILSKESKRNPGFCVKNVDFQGVTICNTGVTLVRGITTCSNAKLQLGNYIVPPPGSQLEPIGITCPNGANFCCAKVVVAPAVNCPDAAHPSTFQITNIYCKP